MVYSENEITKLYRIQKTVMEMLRDRGYIVGDFEVNMSKHEFMEKYGENMKREDLVINKAKKDKPSDQIYVFFPEEVKAGVDVLRTYINRMKSENVSLFARATLLQTSREIFPSPKSHPNFTWKFFKRQNCCLT
jgi:DNA-directed RNA polymerase I, II, and III subunit RPABC1